MRRSELFCETLRQNPADAETAGYQLLLRGGYVQPLASGIFSFLPLGLRVKRKVEEILRQEMDAVGGQEVSMPVVHPAEPWQASARWSKVGEELVRFRDRAGRDLVLAMTHEEVVTDLVRRTIHSYRQLPVVLYQLQTKFRDEPRARGGLIRVREFVMKDAYSCHASEKDLDAFYLRMLEAYHAICHRVGLEVLAVAADVGMMGGTGAHELMFLSDIGEDQIALCDQCGYAANRQTAVFRKDAGEPETPLALEEVETPGVETIASLAEFLGIGPERTAKAAFFMAGQELIFAVVRGDMEVNETKLANAVGVLELRPAGPEDLSAAGIVAGYASPIGVSGVRVVADDLLTRSPNLVAGANRPGFHLRNTNLGRDYTAEVVADIAAATEGAPCAHCGHPLRLVRGVEVANTFKLGTTYSRPLDATFLDQDGHSRHVVMGSYGIGVGRLIGCIAERWRDERGLTWPAAVAPFHVYLVGLDRDNAEVRETADAVYRRLQKAGVEVLYDDREERAGVKFNDADLVGLPLRLTISRRTVQQDGVEMRRRSDGVIWTVPMEQVEVEIWRELNTGGAHDVAHTATGALPTA